jgi:hypothetical protein
VLFDVYDSEGCACDQQCVVLLHEINTGWWLPWIFGPCIAYTSNLECQAACDAILNECGIAGCVNGCTVCGNTSYCDPCWPDACRQPLLQWALQQGPIPNGIPLAQIFPGWLLQDLNIDPEAEAEFDGALTMCDITTTISLTLTSQRSGCPDGFFFDGSTCSPSPHCPPGFAFNPAANDCSNCAPGFLAITDPSPDCLPMPVCPSGTVLELTTGNCITRAVKAAQRCCANFAAACSNAVGSC